MELEEYKNKNKLLKTMINDAKNLYHNEVTSLIQVQQNVNKTKEEYKNNMYKIELYKSKLNVLKHDFTNLENNIQILSDIHYQIYKRKIYNIKQILSQPNIYYNTIILDLYQLKMIIIWINVLINYLNVPIL